MVILVPLAPRLTERERSVHRSATWVTTIGACFARFAFFGSIPTFLPSAGMCFVRPTVIDHFLIPLQAGWQLRYRRDIDVATAGVPISLQAGFSPRPTWMPMT